MPPRSKRLSDHVDDSENGLIIRNVTVLGQRTSMRMEPQIWDAVTDVCARECLTIHDLCSIIAGRRHRPPSLTAALRVFLLSYYRNACTEEGHQRAGHGGQRTAKVVDGLFPGPAAGEGKSPEREAPADGA